MAGMKKPIDHAELTKSIAKKIILKIKILTIRIHINSTLAFTTPCAKILLILKVAEIVAELFCDLSIITSLYLHKKLLTFSPTKES